MTSQLVNDLRRIANISYGATIDEAKDVSNTLREAADLIEQQARDIEALKSDIESQIQLTREAMKVAAGYRDALYGIRRYGLDTLWGRTDGPDDRNWQRAAVNEMTKRARQAIDEGRVALAKAVT